jgi:CHAD domain-containing protein
VLDAIDTPDRDELALDSGAALTAPSNGTTLLDLALVRLSAGLTAVKEAAAADLGAFENLHALRIESKRLRYAMEIFAPCFDDRFRKELYPDFKVLQDYLGEINDAHEMALRFDRYAAELAQTPDEDSGAGLAAGLRRLAGSAREERDRLRRDFLAWWEEFQTSGVLRRIEEYVERPMAPA